MVHNLVGHEPCHDFNPVGTGKRMNILNKMFDTLTSSLPSAIQTAGGDSNDVVMNMVEEPHTEEPAGMNEDVVMNMVEEPHTEEPAGMDEDVVMNMVEEPHTEEPAGMDEDEDEDVLVCDVDALADHGIVVDAFSWRALLSVSLKDYPITESIVNKYKAKFNVTNIDYDKPLNQHDNISNMACHVDLISETVAYAQLLILGSLQSIDTPELSEATSQDSIWGPEYGGGGETMNIVEGHPPPMNIDEGHPPPMNIDEGHPPPTKKMKIKDQMDDEDMVIGPPAEQPGQALWRTSSITDQMDDEYMVMGPPAEQPGQALWRTSSITDQMDDEYMVMGAPAEQPGQALPAGQLDGIEYLLNLFQYIEVDRLWKKKRRLEDPENNDVIKDIQLIYEANNDIKEKKLQGFVTMSSIIQNYCFVTSFLLNYEESDYGLFTLAGNPIVQNMMVLSIMAILVKKEDFNKFDLCKELWNFWRNQSVTENITAGGIADMLTTCGNNIWVTNRDSDELLTDSDEFLIGGGYRTAYSAFDSMLSDYYNQAKITASKIELPDIKNQNELGDHWNPADILRSTLTSHEESEDNEDNSYSLYTPTLIKNLFIGQQCYEGKWEDGVSKTNPKALSCMKECKLNMVNEIQNVIVPDLINKLEALVPQGSDAFMEWEKYKGGLQATISSALKTRLMNRPDRSLFGSRTNRTVWSPAEQLNEHVFSHVQTLFLSFCTSSRGKGKKTALGQKLLSLALQESAEGSVSPDLSNFTNTLLKHICLNLKDIYVKNIHTGNSIFDTEAKIIERVANGGSIGNIDGQLLSAFTEEGKKMEKNQVSVIEDISEYSDLVDYVTNNKAITPYYVVNNALGVKFNDHTKVTAKIEDDKNNFMKPYCPVTSVLDAMGSFGFCYRGYNSPNYECNNMRVDISADDNSFVFATNLNCNKKKGKVAVEYSIFYNDTPSDESQLTLRGQYIAFIGNSAVNVLGANNTMKRAIDLISINAGKFGDVTSFDELFSVYIPDKNDTLLKLIMNIISDKYMGDFGQGLSVIVKNQGSDEHDLKQTLVEADGDRPSFVRNAVLLLSGNPINEQAKLFYMSKSGQKIRTIMVSRKKADELVGGVSTRGRRTKRKCNKPGGRKTKRRNTKHRKTKHRKTKRRKTKRRKTKHRNIKRRKTKRRKTDSKGMTMMEYIVGELGVEH